MNMCLENDKFFRILAIFAGQKHLSLKEAQTFFEQSDLYFWLQSGLGAMEYMSDLWLAEELLLEWQEETQKTSQAL